MTDREKLIELLQHSPTDVMGNRCVGAMADHLISNGVRLETKQATSDENKRWIPVTERLPEEHDSIFAKIYKTERWEPLMFLKISDDVLAVVKFEDGTRKVKTVHTADGEWKLTSHYGAKEVTHWMPLPEPPKEEADAEV